MATFAVEPGTALWFDERVTASRSASVPSLSSALRRIAIASGALLLIPFVAMQFTDGVDWRFGDFLVAGALLMTAGMASTLLGRTNPRRAFRVGTGAVVAAILLLAWAELAVGLL